MRASVEDPTRKSGLTPEAEAISEALHKGLVEFDRAKRTARDLRMIRRGEGPTVKRGTGRWAQVLHLTRAVVAALHDPADDRLAVAREALIEHVTAEHRRAGFAGGHGRADWSVCEHGLCVSARPFAP